MWATDSQIGCLQQYGKSFPLFCVHPVSSEFGKLSQLNVGHLETELLKSDYEKREIL